MAGKLDAWLVKPKDFFRQKNHAERISFLLRFAILAPSTHNSQPWRFKIESDSCKIYTDPMIQITEADPVGRDLYISMGCCIENLILTARYYGVLDKVVFHLMDNKNNLVAEVFFKDLANNKIPDKKLETLMTAMLNRNTVRGLFDPKSLSSDLVRNLKKVNKTQNLQVHLTTDTNKIQKLATLTAQGLRIAYKQSSFRTEMAHWMQSNLLRRYEAIPGYSLRMPTLMSLVFPQLIKVFDLGLIVSKLNYKSMASTPGICVISSNSETKLDWLNVGRLSQRLMLECNLWNTKTSIFIAAVEMANLYKEVQKTLGITQRPQFLFCIGYMTRHQDHTPRHPVESKLLDNY